MTHINKIKKFILLGILLSTVLITIFNYELIVQLNHDDVLYNWSFNKIYHELGFFRYIKLYDKTLLFEDHLHPASFFFAIINVCKDCTPLEFIKIKASYSFIILCLSLFLLFKKIFKDQYFHIIFLIMVLSNKTLMHAHYSSQIIFTYVLITQILCAYFLLKILNKFKWESIIVYGLILLIGTMTFENFFIFYSFAFTYTILNFFSQKNIRTSIIVSVVTTIPIIIYFYLHFKITGSIIPSSRIESDISENIIKNSALIMDYALFGIPSYLATILNKNITYISSITFFFIILFFIYIYNKKKIIIRNLRKNIFFLLANLSMIPLVLYTGRFHDGMWTFLIIISYVSFFLIIKQKIKSTYLKYIIVCGISTYSILGNIHSSALNKIITYNKNVYFIHEAASKIINKKNSDLIIVNYDLDQNFFHPIGFMLSEQILRGGSGIKYYQKEQSIWPASNMSTLFINNNSNTIEINNSSFNAEIIYHFPGYFIKKLNTNSYEISYYNLANPKLNNFIQKNIFKDHQKINVDVDINIKLNNKKNLDLKIDGIVHDYIINKKNLINFDINKDFKKIEFFLDGKNITHLLNKITITNTSKNKHNNNEEKYIINIQTQNQSCRISINNNKADLQYFTIVEGNDSKIISINESTKDIFNGSRISLIKLEDKNSHRNEMVIFKPEQKFLYYKC
jgi:hypothetical protein